MHKKIQTVKTLLDALPFIRDFYGAKIVIKYGGAAQINEELKQSFARDIVLLSLVGIKPIIVHGGGKDITELLTQLGIKTEFIDGVRVTSVEAMRIVEMVLFGDINSEIVALLNSHGARAIGLNGKSAAFIKGVAKDDGKFGYTGEVQSVDSAVLENLLNENFVPVIAPIATGSELGHPGYNINADTLASAVAGAVRAKKVIFMTDIVGVLDKEKNLLSSLSEADIKRLISDGTIAGGMIPKVQACLDAVDSGCEKAHIIDGRVEHSILLELLTSEGIGTQITA